MKKYYDIHYRTKEVGTIMASNYSIVNDELNDICMIKFLDKKNHHIAILNSSNLPKIEKGENRFGKEVFIVDID